jgi:hypothetical protein
MSAAFMSSGGMDRAFSPHRIHLAMNLGRWPRLVWQRAFGPQIRKALQSTASPFFRANGASPCQPGATPQELSHTPNQRAVGPVHYRVGSQAGHHFRGVTKMIPQRHPAAGFYQRSSSQGFLDYSNRRRSRATVKESLTVQSEQLQRAIAEESSVVQTTGGKGIGRAFSPREIVSTGFLGRCPRLVWRWAFGPETQTAPTARFYTSLGQRPRYATPTRIEG